MPSSSSIILPFVVGHHRLAAVQGFPGAVLRLPVGCFAPLSIVGLHPGAGQSFGPRGGENRRPIKLYREGEYPVLAKRGIVWFSEKGRRASTGPGLYLLC